MSREALDAIQDIYESRLAERLPNIPFIFHDYFLNNTKVTVQTRYNYSKYLLDFLSFYDIKNPAVKYDIETIRLFTRTDVESFLDKRNYSVHQRNISLTALSSIFEYMRKNGSMEENPCIYIERTASKHKQMRAITEERKNRIIDTIVTGEGLSQKQLEEHKNTCTRDLLIAKLIYSYNLTIADVRNLDLCDIDLKNDTLKICRKNESISLSMDNDIVAIIENYMNNCRNLYESVDPLHPLFLSYKGRNIGGRLSERSIQRMLKKYESCGEKNAYI